MSNKVLNIVTFLGILYYLAFFAYSYVVDLFRFYAADAVIFFVVVILLRIFYKRLNLNIPVYTLVILTLSLHLYGTFGWYNISPLPIQWDHITHFVPLFALTLVLFCAFQKFMKRFWTLRTWVVLAMIFLAGLGMGSLVESFEFSGFLAFGFGEGGLRMGGLGDGLPEDAELTEKILEAGGGYFNTELDLLYNTAGVLLALIICSLLFFSRARQSSFQEPFL